MMKYIAILRGRAKFCKFFLHMVHFLLTKAINSCLSVTAYLGFFLKLFKDSLESLDLLLRLVLLTKCSSTC